MGVDLFLASIRYMALATTTTTTDSEPYYTTINTDYSYSVEGEKGEEEKQLLLLLDHWSSPHPYIEGDGESEAIINCLDRSLGLCVCGLKRLAKRK